MSASLKSLFLILILSDFTDDYWKPAIFESSGDEPIATSQDYFPLALRLRKQIVEKIEAPPLISANVRLTDYSCVPMNLTACVHEMTELFLASANLVYLFMSLQL